MRKTNRVLSVVLAVVMLFGCCVFANAEGNLLAESQVPTFSDMVADGHWAKEALDYNVRAQIIKGYEDDTVRPSRNMTRAEMAAIINRAFGATVEMEINFDDVNEGQWFYHEVAKAYNMRSFLGTGEKTMDPNDPIRREDVFLAMARVLVLHGGNQSVLNNFVDGNEVDSWALDAMATLIEKGYINGNNQNELNPRDPITRAEFSQFMYNIFKTYYHIEGKYNRVSTEGSVMLRGKNVTLENVTVNGDLVLGDGVGIGDAHLTNVTIKGRLLCRGGEGYVYLKNVTVGENVVVNDVNGTVNFYNYRDEAVFNGVTEYTPATYLKRPSVGGGGGGVNYHTVTFEYTAQTNAGATSATKYVSVVSGSTVPSNKFPTDEYDAQGRAFAGWYDSNGKEYTTATTITKNVTLKPKWYSNEQIALELVYAEGVAGNETVTLPAVNMNRKTDGIANKAKELLAQNEFATGYDKVHFGTGTIDGIFTKNINGYTLAENDKDVNMLEVNLVDLVGENGLKEIFKAGYRSVDPGYEARPDVMQTINYIIDTAVTDNLIKVEENTTYHNYSVAVIAFRNLLADLEWDDVKAYVPTDYTNNVPEAVIKTVFERTRDAIAYDMRVAIDSVYFASGQPTDVSFIVKINPVTDGYVHTVDLIGDNAAAVASIADWATVARMFNADRTAETGYDFLSGAEMQTELVSAVTMLNDAANATDFEATADVIGEYVGKTLTVIDLLAGTDFADEYTSNEDEIEEIFADYEKNMTVEDFYAAFKTEGLGGGQASGRPGGSSSGTQKVTQKLPFVTVRWTLTYTIAD